MRNTVKRLSNPTGFLWLGLWLLFASASFAAMAAVIKVVPDRDVVRMNETFNLVFSSADKLDDDPDFTPLSQDFEILNQSQNNQFSVVNGSMSRLQEWTLTLSPKRTGNLPIPPIAFGSDQSPAGILKVLDADAAIATPGAAADNAEIRLEVDAEPKNPYVQAQVIYSVRVWLPVNRIVGADLSEPNTQEVLIERLGEDRHYRTHQNGREYEVTERKYALFPQKSGLVRLEPLQLSAQVDAGARSFFARSTRVVRVRSEAIDLKVRPIPAAFTGKHWLPATDLQLEESWPKQPPQAKAGDPLTQTLTLKAKGATVSVLPELATESKLDASIKQYPDQPSLNESKTAEGLVSTRQEKTALIPGKGGEYSLPALEIPWWNTSTDRMEFARLPERSLHVEGSAEPAPPPVPVQPVPSPLKQDGPAQPPVESNPVPAGHSADGVWVWLAGFFALGWLATALAWWSQRRQSPTPKQPPEATAKIGAQRALEALRKACQSQDALAARQALLAWAEAHWPQQRPASLVEIAQLDVVLAGEINALSKALYGSVTTAWQGEGLWRAVEQSVAKVDKPGGSAELEPLYRS